MIVNNLVDHLDRDHDAEIAVLDLVGIDKLAATVDSQLIIFDVEGTSDLPGSFVRFWNLTSYHRWLTFISSVTSVVLSMTLVL